LLTGLRQPQVLRHAARMTIAALLAFVAAWVFALPEGYWAVISAVVVMQSNIGGTLGAILDRMMARSGWLAFHLAVAHLRRVETRVHVALWHFADRWGRVRPGGIELRLNLTHALLADIVAAERPSVTLALSTLRERGLVDRDPDHVWHLHGRPPGELDDVRAQAAMPLR